MEEYNGERPNFVGCHGCMDEPENLDYIEFGQFKFNYKGIANKTPSHLKYEQAKVLVAVAKQDTNGISQFILENLVDYGYLIKTDGKYELTFRVTFKDKIGEMTTEQAERHERLYKEACQVASEHYQFCRELIYLEIPDFFKDNQYQIDYACSNSFNLRGAVLEEALEKGYISYADNDERKMLGAYLII